MVSRMAVYRLQGRPTETENVFHLDVQVWTGAPIKVYRKDVGGSSQQTLLDDLFEIEGVASVTLHPFAVEIERGVLFPWGGLYPGIIEVLEKHLTDGERMAKM